MSVKIGARTDVGRLRSANEDSYLIDPPLFVIADGMGGHIAGDVASSTVIETISAHRQEISPTDPQTLAQLVRDANSAVWSRAQSDPSLHGMGTTCTLIYIDDGRAHVAHVGDSRAYRLRDGQLEQLTEDHTLVWRMVREGKIPAAEAERHPQRNVITRALGIDSDVSVDLTAVELSAGDRFLLCSDGLPSMVSQEEIEEALRSEPDPQAAADLLVEKANDAGGEDNVTVVVLDPDAESSTGSGRALAPAEASRVKTDRPGEHGERYRRGRRWATRLFLVLVVLALLGVGGYALASYSLDNSWFVGVDEEDRITIFSGIPEEIAGVELRREERITSTRLAELPSFLRADVKEGIKVSSLQEAQETIADLNDRAREFAEERRDRAPKG